MLNTTPMRLWVLDKEIKQTSVQYEKDRKQL